MSKRNKVIIVILIILIVAVVLADIILVYKTKHRPKPPSLEVIPYTHQYYQLEDIECNLTKQDIKVILDLVYDTKYTYSEQDNLGCSIQGAAISNPNRIIVLTDLDIITYITVLSHEITHLKYKTSDETFTEYTSIISLYKTNIRLFQAVALNRAKVIIGGGYSGTDYDCGYYLLNYFEEVLNEQ